MDDVVRIGLIGLGAVAELHLEAYREVQGAIVVAGADLSAQRCHEMADRYGFKPYTNVKCMLSNERLDAACILVPAAAHRDVVVACAVAGLHVLCEKPIATTIEDAEEMLSVCNQQDVKFFYGASYRFLPTVTRARELIRSGAIGDVVLLSETLVGGRGMDGYQQLTPAHYPTGTPGGSGLGLVDHGIHMIDLFPWLIDDEIERVLGRGTLSGGRPMTEYMLMHFTAGAVGHLLYNAFTFGTELPQHGTFSRGQGWTNDGTVLPTGSWVSHPGFIHVHGTRGAMRLGHYVNTLHLIDPSGIRDVPLENKPPPAHFGLQLEAFLDCIRNDGRPAVTGEEGILALKTLLAAYEKG